MWTRKLPKGAQVLLRALFTVADKVKYGWNRWLTEEDRGTSTFREACLEHDCLAGLQASLVTLDAPLNESASVLATVQYPYLDSESRQTLYRCAFRHRRLDALRWLLQRYPYDVLEGPLEPEEPGDYVPLRRRARRSLLQLLEGPNDHDRQWLLELWLNKRVGQHHLHDCFKGPDGVKWALTLPTDLLALLDAATGELTDELGRGLLTDELGRGLHVAALQHLYASHAAAVDVVKVLDNAAAGGHLEMVKWLYSLPEWADTPLQPSHHVETWTRALQQAAANGHLAVVQFLRERQPQGAFPIMKHVLTTKGVHSFTMHFVALELAAANGHLEVFQYLYAHFPPEVIHHNNDIVGLAAQNGHLEIVRFVLERHPEWVTFCAWNNAATGGHLEILKLLHQHQSKGCTFCAMNAAAMNGHLDVVGFLHQHRTEGCTTAAMNGAATHGHLEVVRFLHQHRTEGCTADAMNWAATHGQLAAIQWLHEHRTEGCTTAAMNGAARNGHLEVVRFLHEHRTEGCTADAMVGAAWNGHLEVVQWLHEHRTEGCTTEAMDGAARNGHLDVVRWLHENRTEGCTAEAMDAAARHGHLEVVRWLHKHRTEGCTPDAMDGAAANGHLEVIQCLYAQGMSLQAVEETLIYGHVDLVMFWHRHCREHLSQTGLRTAQKPNVDYPQTVKNWLALYSQPVAVSNEKVQSRVE